MSQFTTAAACILCALSATQASGATTTQTLAQAGVWVIAPPKTVTPIPEVELELGACRSVWFVSTDSSDGRAAARRLAQRLSRASGLPFRCQEPESGAAAVRLGVLSDGKSGKALPGITAADMDGLGSEGYALHIDADGVSIAARDWPGLVHGAVLPEPALMKALAIREVGRRSKRHRWPPRRQQRPQDGPSRTVFDWGAVDLVTAHDVQEKLLR